MATIGSALNNRHQHCPFPSLFVEQTFQPSCTNCNCFFNEKMDKNSKISSIRFSSSLSLTIFFHKIPLDFHFSSSADFHQLHISRDRNIHFLILFRLEYATSDNVGKLEPWRQSPIANSGIPSVTRGKTTMPPCPRMRCVSSRVCTPFGHATRTASGPRTLCSKDVLEKCKKGSYFWSWGAERPVAQTALSATWYIG